MKTIVPEDWNVPLKIRNRFGETAGRQRIMTADGHLVLVLHEPPGPDDPDRKARLFWRDPNGRWAWTSSGDTMQLLKRHILEFTKRGEVLENQLQMASCASDYFALLQATAPLHRTSSNLHATLQQAREAVPEDQELIVARDAANDLERTFELLQADAKNGLDFMVAQRAEQQSQRTYEMAVSSHRLNIIAAIFFPITALSSVLGMNVVSGLEFLPGIVTFWSVLLLGFGSGVMLVKAISNTPLPDQNANTKNQKTKTQSTALASKVSKRKLQNAAR
jgi:hypothetical protein